MSAQEVGTVSQRDVVFTPFMLRVREALDTEEPPASPHLRPSEVRRVAAATHEWFSLRARAEQVVAEANAMLAGRGPTIDLCDEAGTGELGFRLHHGSRSVRISMGRRDRRGWVDLRFEPLPGRKGGPVEPADDATLEDLVIDILSPERNGNGNR